MPQILIEPITRIEGHARIRLLLDEDGRVGDVQFQVTQIRGFEQFVRGRPYYEMPSITARICGICPVSHALASAKACDQILAVVIPPTAILLRRVLHFGQIIQSHALSFFYLAGPDLLLGLDHPPESRNFLGLAAVDPQCARDGIRLRRFGQQLIESLAGRRIHPGWVVPGGVDTPLEETARSAILDALPAVKALVATHLDRFKQSLDRYREPIEVFGHFPSLFLGLVDQQGQLELYDGRLRVMDAAGTILADDNAADAYQRLIGEAIEPWTYLSFPYYKPQGYPTGMYRVGPLARLNLATNGCGTELADRELTFFRSLADGPVLSSFHGHLARLIELLHAVEMVELLLAAPAITNRHVRARAGVNNLEGIGIAEAPRGTLIHHYRVDVNGLIEWVNLIIATGHNNLAMHRGLLQAARHFLKQAVLTEGLLNRLEAVIRTFDPCLSCSTHAVGAMPLVIELLDPDGRVVDRVQR